MVKKLYFCNMINQFTNSPEQDAAMPEPTADTVERIKYLIQQSRHTQASFAKLLGIDPANLSRMLSRKTRISEGFINRLVADMGVSKKWLTTGLDIPFPRREEPECKSEQRRGTPVYDIDVTAGCRPLARMCTDDRIIGYVDLPLVDPSFLVVKVSGESMTPKVPNNSYIAIRPVRLDSPIAWGQVYVVVLEDFRLVKIINPHPDPDKLVLHSANAEYADMVINRSDVFALYVVEIVMKYDYIG